MCLPTPRESINQSNEVVGYEIISAKASSRQRPCLTEKNTLSNCPGTMPINGDRGGETKPELWAVIGSEQKRR
jgi:hypothetical protein